METAKIEARVALSSSTFPMIYRLPVFVSAEPCLIFIRDLLARVQRVARYRGLTTENLVNLLLEQRLQEVDVPSAAAS